MKLGKRILLLGLAAVLAFNAFLVLGNDLRSASFRTPFGWQDEGYVLGPALAVYDRGWESYRCRGDQIVCYGAVHTFFDALVLRALPEAWVKQDALIEPPGPTWFYRSRYPNAFVALRVFRVALTVLLLATVGGIAWRSLRSPVFGALWMLALPAFGAFRAARMGLKNDFSFALFLVLFLVLADRSLREAPAKANRRFFLAAVVAGAVGVSIKFGMILPVAALVPAYALSARLRGRRARELLADAILAALAGGAAFVLTNPGLRISLSEANWFSSFLAATARAPGAGALRTELFGAVVPNLWPLLFFAFPAAALVAGRNRKEWVRYAYLFAVPLIWTFLTWKSGYFRLAYYLPILTWTLVALAWIARPPEYAWVLFFGCVAWQAATHVGSERAARSLFEERLAASSASEPWRIFDCGAPGCENDRWIVDRTLRAAVPARIGEDRVMFFDSLSDSPAIVGRWAFEKWGVAEGRTRVLASCWQDPPAPKDAPTEYASPAAEAWAKLMKSECKQSTPIDANAAFAFENGWRSTRFATLALDELRKRAPADAPLPLDRDGLSPRMLRGSWKGIDSWYAPVILGSDAVLEGSFRFPAGANELDLPFESTCKGGGEVEIATDSGSAKVSADSRPALCRKRPWVCRIGLEDWWTERIPLGPAVLHARIPRGGSGTIRIRIAGADPDRCRISLGTILFHPMPNDAKVGK